MAFYCEEQKMNLYLLELCMWAAQIFYFVCFVPQLFTNFKLKSGSGISELFLVFYLNTYIFLVFYIFALGLPLAYKIMVPIQGFATLILIFQRLYYDQNNPIKLWVFYIFNFFSFLTIIPYAIKNPISIGALFGWVAFLFVLLNQLPQVFKIYREKSVQGFNYMFVFFTGLAALIETITVFVVGLPIQTKVMALRGVILFLIFSWQFKIYRK
jgi:uncharacterized protein with PQ loop repeat